MKGYEDNGWTDRWKDLSYEEVAAILDIERDESLQQMIEEEKLDFAFSIVGKGVNPDADEIYEFNKYELMGWSHDASLILIAAEEFGEAITVIANQIARAFAPTMDFICDFWDELKEIDYYNTEKHFDGVYYKPKMFEYYKTRPNAVNLNHKIRKARNSLWRMKNKNIQCG